MYQGEDEKVLVKDTHIRKDEKVFVEDAHIRKDEKMSVEDAHVRIIKAHCNYHRDRIYIVFQKYP